MKTSWEKEKVYEISHLFQTISQDEEQQQQQQQQNRYQTTTENLDSELLNLRSENVKLNQEIGYLHSQSNVSKFSTVTDVLVKLRTIHIFSFFFGINFCRKIINKR